MSLQCCKPAAANCGMSCAWTRITRRTMRSNRYHDTRRAVLKDHIPPSTSTLTQRLLLGGQEIEVHMIAIVPKGDFKAEHIRPGDHAVHATSGYSLALAAENYVFVAGRMAVR